MVFFDGSGARIIGREGEQDLIRIVLVAFEEFAEIVGAAFGVLPGIFGVDAESFGRFGHELHEAERAFGGDGCGLEAGFGVHHAAHEGFREGKFAGGLIGEAGGRLVDYDWCRWNGFRRCGRCFGGGNDFVRLDGRDLRGWDFGDSAGAVDDDVITRDFVAIGMDLESACERDGFTCL